MDPILKYSIIINILSIFEVCRSDIYNVKIGTEHHVNLVDTKFLSFTVDPKYLFGSSEKYNNKQCICMASSLTPAYLRIAGPSTSRMMFRNTTITLEESHTTSKEDQRYYYPPVSTRQKDGRLSLTHKQWGKFVHWAKKTGFDFVFALNNENKMASGLWDPNSALHTLTVAEKVHVGDIYWQLGYECANQSIEEYINDLETLRVIVESFPPGRTTSWRVLGGDIAPCLQADSKSDFKDYVTLSNDMLDAVFLNGNSSAQQLEKMSAVDRQKLLVLLSNSDTPLWLTERVPGRYSELERAADWLASLGYSARNGFSVHYRELLEEELHEPTLSFYMALIYKNLVGERVLDINMTASQATMFAHCTSLRRKPISGAVTLYGANMDDESARFSLKLSKREEGGDIMQFIFGHDSSGNIVVNGRAMYLEGDIRPVVKRVRPYKTLLINLPPKSFGFWVLANTRIEACLYNNDFNNETELIEDSSRIEENTEVENGIQPTKSSIRKRDVATSHLENSFEVLEDRYSETDSKSDILRKQIDNLINELKNFHDLLIINKEQRKNQYPMRFKRQVNEKEIVRKSNKKGFKSKFYKNVHDKQLDFKSNLLDKLLKFKNEKLSKIGKSKFNKKSFKRSNTKACSEEYFDNNEKRGKRRRRSVIKNKTINNLERSNGRKSEKNKLYERTIENEVNADEEVFPFGKLMHIMKGDVRHIPVEIEEKVENADNEPDVNEITVKTKLSDDVAIINISEKANSGLLRSTLEDLITLFSDLNKQLNRFWSTFTILE